MYRFLLALLFAVSCLNATSFTFTSCTAGTITLSPCDSNLTLTEGGLVSSQYVVRTYAAVPSPFANGAPVSALATGLAQLNAPSGSISLSGIAEASDSITYQSTGPVRAGFIEFNLALLYPNEDFQGAATSVLTDGVHDYVFIGGAGADGPVSPVHCTIGDCDYVGVLPFTLGSQFEISASAVAYPNREEGSSESIVSFTLLGPDGVTPVPFSEVPEPFTCGVEMVGLGLILSLRMRPRSRGQDTVETKTDW